MFTKGAFICSVVCLAAAFPSNINLEKRLSAKQISQQEKNTGFLVATTFDAEEQFVDVQPGSAHEFRPPGPTDKRGECPGLNAASNHGFLPRDGLPTILETVTGLGAAYAMAPDLAGFLAVVAVALTGDPISETWSIGGAFSGPAGILSEPQGIVNSHNKYESDASPCRYDAYLNNGNSEELRMESFEKLYNMAESFTLDTLRQHNLYVSEYSVANNPYYFSAPFAGLVAPAAHEFVVNFMSNHSAEEPSGYLNRDHLKTFFSVSGPDDALTWKPGYEQIPQNWYRRPSITPYTVPGNLADTALTAVAYPGSVRIGGNTNGPNTFAGIDISDLTGGVYNSENLFEGNNLGCFFIQAFQVGLPDELRGGVADLAQVLGMVDKYTSPILKELNCPALATYNQGLFNKFPGYNYTGH